MAESPGSVPRSDHSVVRRSLLKLVTGGVGIAVLGGAGDTTAAEDGVASGPTLYTDGFAIDADTGDEIWSVDEFEPSEVDGSSVVVDGTLYFATQKRDDPDEPFPRDAGIAAVDAVTGDLEWRFVPPGTDDVESPLVSSPTVVAGTVYATIQTAPSGEDEPVTLFAVDADAGDEVWRTGVPRRFTPVVTNGTVYGSSRTVYGHESTLRAVNADTGEEKWVYDSNGFEVATKPMATADTVFVGVEPQDRDERAGLHALDAETGELDWTFLVDPSRRFSSAMQPVIADGAVIFGEWGANRDEGELNHLYAIDVESGDERWRWFQDTVIGTGESIRNPSIVADGTVFVVTYADDLFALDLETGEERWNTSVSDRNSITVYDGDVYIRSEPGLGGSPAIERYDTDTGSHRDSIPISSLPTAVDDPATGESVDAATTLGLYGHGDAFAEGVDEVPEEVTVSTEGDVIDDPGGEWTLAVDAEAIDELAVERLWTDWDVDVEEGDGGDPTDDVADDGAYTLAWAETRSTVGVELTVSPPERYEGGEYLVTVVAIGPDETAGATATLGIE